MKKSALIIGILCLATQFCFAPLVKAEDDPGSEKILLAQKIFDQNGYIELIKIQSHEYALATLKQYRDTFKPMDSATEQKFVAELESGMSADRNELLPVDIKIYAESFTLEELKGILAFYETDLGKSFIKKSPAIHAKISKNLYSVLTGRSNQRWIDLIQKYHLVAKGL